MSGHGHESCPNCQMVLEGMEPLCPQCEGDLYGIPAKPSTKREKAIQIAKKLESETKEAIDNVAAATTQTMKKVSEKIGEHEIPVFTNVNQVGSEAVEKIRGSLTKDTSENGGESEQSNLAAAASQWDDEWDNDEETTSDEVQSAPLMDIDAMLDRGEMLVAEGREQQALKLFNQVIAEDPSNAMAWFNRGIVHEMSGQRDDAKKAFKVCVDMDPTHGPAAANLAVMLERDGEKDAASKMASRALRAFPTHGELIRIAALSPSSGSEDGSRGQSPSTAASLGSTSPQMSTLPPPDATAEGRGEAQPEPSVSTIGPAVEQSLPPATESATSSVTSISEEGAVDAVFDIESTVEKAAELVKQGLAEDALELLRDLLHKEAAEHPRAWRIAAASMARLSLTDSAIEAFTYALDLDNSDAPSWFNLGALHRRNGHEDAAVTCFEAAIGLKPDYAKASAALAEILTSRGDLAGAIDAWRYLLSIEPTHPGGSTLAGILISIGEGEGEVIEMATELPVTIPEGPELATEALGYISDDGSVANTMMRARALTLIGSYPEAVGSWRSLVEVDRDNPELWTGMMKTFIAAGDQTTANKCRQKIHSLTGVPLDAPSETEVSSTDGVAEGDTTPPSEEIAETPTDGAAEGDTTPPSDEVAETPTDGAAEGDTTPPSDEVAETPAALNQFASETETESMMDEASEQMELGTVEQVEPSQQVEAESSEAEPRQPTDEGWGDDPWGDDGWVKDDEAVESVTIYSVEGGPESTGERGEISATESSDITAAEAVLESVTEPDDAPQSEPSPEVDLAKAALDAQAITARSDGGTGQIDSSSVANQDVQWYNKGLALISEEKYKEALACFEKALPSFMNDDEMVVAILNARGNAFYYLRNFKECIDSYIKAQKVDPSRVTGATLYNMGTAYAEVERYDDAIKCFEYAMSPKRISPLSGDHAKMAKEQIRRCKLLRKEQEKKLKRLAKLQG